MAEVANGCRNLEVEQVRIFRLRNVGFHVTVAAKTRKKKGKTREEKNEVK